MGDEVRLEFIVPFIKAAHNVFGSMIGVEIVRKQVSLKTGYAMFGDVSGVIGMSGPTTGICVISMPARLASSTIERMIGEPIQTGIADPVTRDGVGELINMIAGQAKSLLAGSHKFDITLPTIIAGKGHEIFQKKGTRTVVVLFEEPETKEQFTLEVSINEKR